ncbi:hypothetical protein OC845_001139 [Tilletia horrida]|nr:hypothetical protein OC845_001139 [Tilletia horrida]
MLLAAFLCLFLTAPWACVHAAFNQTIRPAVDQEPTQPAVTIAQGTYLGLSTDVNGHSLETFLGVRYAAAPIRARRFQKPRFPSSGNQTYNATAYASTCYQATAGPHSEDCLFLNIIRPHGLSSYTKLPVMIFIHGGSFQFGSGDQADGRNIVAESVAAGAPVIWISINYRLGVFGFLGGSSVLSAAKAGSAVLNPGMYDTRMAMRWVQTNIASFRGNPNKVTLVGQSAGAFIIGNNLLANKGNPGGLFQAVIMESGSPGSASTSPPDHPKVDETFAKISDAQGLNPFMPVQDFQVDGFFFSAPPHVLVAKGKFATVPVISGCMHDEGTGGAPKTLSDPAALEDWFRTVAVINSSNATLVDKVLNTLFKLYPDDNTLGSPYYNSPTSVSVGTTNTSDPYFPPATNQFKRAAALYGAWRYEAPHRKFILQRYHALSSGVWSYRWSQHDASVAEYLGVTHSSELPYLFGNTTGNNGGAYAPLSKTLQRAWISFANFHDPRRLGTFYWPPFSASGRSMIDFKGEDTTVIQETYRESPLMYFKSAEAAQVLSS